MQYFGAADYFFWQGVGCAIVRYNYTEAMSWAPTFHMDNKTTRACSEAFEWGVIFGLNISEQEYAQMLLQPEVKRDIITETLSEKLDIEIEPNVIGNC